MAGSATKVQPEAKEVPDFLKRFAANRDQKITAERASRDQALIGKQRILDFLERNMEEQIDSEKVGSEVTTQFKNLVASARKALTEGTNLELTYVKADYEKLIWQKFGGFFRKAEPYDTLKEKGDLVQKTVAIPLNYNRDILSEIGKENIVPHDKIANAIYQMLTDKSAKLR